MNTFKRRKIGEILVERGDLNPSDLSFVLAIIKSTGERFGKICLVNALVSEEALAKALAEQYGMEYVDLKGFKMDEAILEIFPHVLPKDTIYRHHCVPLESLGNSLVVAVDDPTDIIKLDELEFSLHRPVIFKLATESAIESVLRKEEGTDRLYKDVQEEPKVGSFGVKLPVTSFEKSLYFYREFLGLRVKKQTKDTVVFEDGLVLVNGQYAATFTGGVHLRSLVYVHVTNIEESFSRAVKQNIRIISKLAPWDKSRKLLFRCQDPDGNIVEVIPNGGLEITKKGDKE